MQDVTKSWMGKDTQYEDRTTNCNVQSYGHLYKINLSTFTRNPEKLLKYPSFSQLHVCILQQVKYKSKYQTPLLWWDIKEIYNIIHKTVLLFLPVLYLERPVIFFQKLYLC